LKVKGSRSAESPQRLHARLHQMVMDDDIVQCFTHLYYVCKASSRGNT